MNEEVIDGGGSVDSSTDLTTVVESVNELTEAIQVQQDQKVLEEETAVEEEKTTNELLQEMLTTMEEQQPTEEEIQAQSLTVEEQATVDQNIEQQLILLNENVLALTEQMPKEEIVVEGFFYCGLSVVISIAVYMFWNQLSKW